MIFLAGWESALPKRYRQSAMTNLYQTPWIGAVARCHKACESKVHKIGSNSKISKTMLKLRRNTAKAACKKKNQYKFLSLGMGDILKMKTASGNVASFASSYTDRFWGKNKNWNFLYVMLSLLWRAQWISPWKREAVLASVCSTRQTNKLNWGVQRQYWPEKCYTRDSGKDNIFEFHL